MRSPTPPAARTNRVRSPTTAQTPSALPEGPTRSPVRPAFGARTPRAALALALVGIPCLFLFRFGHITAIGWAVTAFVAAVLLVVVLSPVLARRPDLHASASARGDWLDKAAVVWFLSVSLGIPVGWLATRPPLLTHASWPWLLGLRVALTLILPLLTMAGPLRYLTRRNWHLTAPLVLGLTALAVWTSVDAARDLLALEAGRIPHAAGTLTLPHTDLVIEGDPTAPPPASP
jgi:hypothetical protein